MTKWSYMRLETLVKCSPLIICTEFLDADSLFLQSFSAWLDNLAHALNWHKDEINNDFSIAQSETVICSYVL